MIERVAVIGGTGEQGFGLAVRWAHAGIECVIGSRDRRRAEEAARRVPGKLLFPLVFCTLPAFALLTVAPLVASALESLRL